VIVRHGETQHNKFKQWASWYDAKLSLAGEQEAIDCGKTLKTHGFEFDLAYASMLGRSIKTLNFILEEMDCAYIPVLKRWQLNEKFYGALQVTRQSCRDSIR
jgi:2,3-bisphosphoglycerate-dependent phosphoglycerate mutase